MSLQELTLYVLEVRHATQQIARVTQGGPANLGHHIHTTWPSVVEAIGCTGLYDYVEFVGEYGPYDLHDLDNLCRAAEVYNMSMMIK